jgi:molybdopterin-guanine dinucleotide biosynthesis protein A
VADVKGLILAGGHSSRFGSDKAAVVLHQQPQLDFLTDLLGELLSEVFVSIRAEQGGEPLRASHPQIHDIYQGFGPAGGLLAAHAHYPDCAWLVVACDMPLLSADIIRELLKQRDTARAATAYASGDGEPEPLCAIYEPATLASFHSTIKTELGLEPDLAADVSAGKELRVPGPKRLLRDADTKLIRVSSESGLQSFNTPDELAAIRSHPDFDQS